MVVLSLPSSSVAPDLVTATLLCALRSAESSTFLKVLLVFLFCSGVITQWLHFGDHLAAILLLSSVERSFRGLFLGVARYVDAASVLRTDVVALSIQSGRIVKIEKELREMLKIEFFVVVRHENNFSVS